MLKGLKTYLTNGMNRRGKHFRQSLILILVVSAIPGLIIGGLIYWLAGGRIETELHQLHNSQMLQRVANINDQLSYLELSLSHWAYDPKFNDGLKEKNWMIDFSGTGDLTKTLLIMQGSNPLVRRVDLYVNGLYPLLLTPGYGGANPGVNQIYSALLSQGKPAFWTEIAGDPATPDQKDLALVHKIPGSSTDPFGVIVVRLDPDKLSRYLKTLTSSDDGHAFLTDGRSIIASATGASDLTDPFNQALHSVISGEKSRQGSFLFEWNRMTFTVSYGTFPRIGSNWTYVSAAPINAITAPVVFVSKLIWTISLTVLLIAAAMAWFASSKIYSPVDRLVRLLIGGVPQEGKLTGDEFKLMELQWHSLTKESISLRNKLERQLPHVKEGFLLQLIQGYLYSYSEHDLRERMRHYGWTVDDHRFVVLYMQLTGFTNLDGRFMEGDQGLVTFAAANIVKELASERLFQSEVVNFHDLSIGLLVMVPAVSSYKQQLELLGNDLIKAINGIVKLQVTIAISRPSDSIVQIHSMFEETQQAISYRSLINQNEIIDMDLADSHANNDELNYPIALEKEVIQKLQSGQQAETEEAIAKFIGALSGEDAKEIDVQQGMLQLLGSIQYSVMHAGINPKRIFQGVNMFEQLSQLREPQLMLAWFRRKVVHPYIKELELRSSDHVKKTVRQVILYIQNHYTGDISLDQCADLTNTNPYFLSKAFKQVTGNNFIDYLTELRLNRVKEMLRDTELKINDVAQRVGYQHSYLNRIFKKQEGVTPSQYRELSRKV